MLMLKLMLLARRSPWDPLLCPGSLLAKQTAFEPMGQCADALMHG